LFLTLPLAVIATPGFILLLREYLSLYPQFPRVVLQVNDWHHFSNPAFIREVSARLKLYDIGLSTDDIGILYSAITKSETFPFDEFKLTTDYVSNCALNDAKKQLCGGVINLAHSGGATVCAQGVTNRDELKTLIDLQCDMAQGCVFGEPQSWEVFETNFFRSPPEQRADADVDTGSFEWPAAGPSSGPPGRQAPVATPPVSDLEASVD